MLQRYLCLLCMTGLLLGCQSRQYKQPTIDNPATAFVAAYNAHDIDRMLSLVHPELRYMFINNEQLHLETNSKKVLANYLVDFFKQQPKAQSKVISSQQHGPFIQQIEQAIYTTAAGVVRSQCSLSVYQMQDQLIINVWYFDAFSCPES